MRRTSLAGLVLLLASLPLFGGTCTDEKVVEIVIGFPTTVRLVAEGEMNTHMDTDTVDIKADLDIPGALDDADVDPADLTDITVAQVFYRVVQPDTNDPNRTIVNGNLTVARVVGGVPQAPAVLVSGWSMNAGSANVADPTAWIDITADIGAPGIALLNQLLDECVAELNGGLPVLNPEIQYSVSGDSNDPAIATLFEYEIKVVFQTVIPQTYEVPF
ncbi:MAG TPA: hypothetical protein VKU85_07900 [bacterium]|nr:hypothetical protein [bacterium]